MQVWKESLNTEFKSSFNDAVIETLVAFANTNGGKVLIGVNNEGMPLRNFMMGDETVQQWVNEMKNKTQPSLIPDAEVIQYKGANVIALSVNEFPIKPVSFKGRYFKRVGNSNHLLNLTEIADLHLKTFNNSWDNYITNDYILDDISLDKVNLFKENSNKFREIKIEDDPLTVLNKFELIKGKKIANACHLLFARGDVFKATIELGRFSTLTLIKDALTLRTDLFSETEAIFDFVKKHINKAYIITGKPQREERWQYPMDAIREIIINMVVHRDYMHYGDSSVKIYDNNIEFFNPGCLPGSITIEQLIQGNYVSQIRNKKLAAMFKEAGLIEKYGSGIKRIQQQFIAYGLNPPVFENFQHGFRVLVFAKSSKVGNEVGNEVGNKVGNEVGIKVLEKLSINQEKILELVQKDPFVTAKILSTMLGISLRKTEENLRKLKEVKKIKRIGSNRSGHWAIIESIEHPLTP